MSEASPDPSKPAIPAAEHGNPLPYEAPRDRLQRDPPVNVLGATFVVIFGSAISLAAVFFVSAFVFMSMNNLVLEPPAPARTSHPADRVAGCLYILGFAAIIWKTYRYFRRPAKLDMMGRWFLIGLLMGLGVGCLIEGVCFVAQ